MTPSLLTAQDAAGHIHLIIGSNPLANARCSKSIEVGAKPKVIAPPNAEVHYALAKRIESGEVEWLKKSFEDGDLETLGREEVDKVVDAVFVTIGKKDSTGMDHRLPNLLNLVDKSRGTYILSMPQTTYTGQCSRCPKPLYLYNSIDTLRRTSSNWHNHLGERM